MVKAGEVAYVKTTEEPVFVLATSETDAKVRRPTAGQNGITHNIEEFFLVELESKADVETRKLAEREEIIARFAQGAKDTGASKSALPALN